MNVIGVIVTVVGYAILTQAFALAESRPAEWALAIGWTVTTCSLIGLGAAMALGVIQ